MINKEISMRTTLTIPKDLKSELEVLAKEDNRSVNNLIINILSNYVKGDKNKKNVTIS
ncbi:MAG: ribbon-helix-helix domain-containing protein [Paraclostridium sp.]